MFIYRLKNFMCVCIAVLFTLLVGVGIKLVNVSRLSALEGERMFFLDSASSQGLVKRELAIFELGRVKGECVSFSIDEEEGGRYALSAEIIEKFQAELLFVERIGETLSYYCYTPLWQDGIFIQGQRVNLHVAISEVQCVVGTPIIFGGF